MNSLMAKYLECLHKEARWRWDKDERLAFPPSFNVINAVCEIAAADEAEMNGGKARIKPIDYRVKMGLMVMQMYVIWASGSRYSADFETFVAELNNKGDWKKVDDWTAHNKKVQATLGMLMTGTFGVVSIKHLSKHWPWQGTNIAECVNAAVNVFNPEVQYMAKMPNMVQ